MRRSVDDFPDDESGSTRLVTHEWDGEARPSTVIVETVAATTGREPTDLPPLYNYIDGEALDTLLDSGSTARDGHINVQFRYEGVVVTVRSDGLIAVDQEPGVA